MADPKAYLLDTHILLWWLNGDPRITSEREQQLSSRDCLISAASVWEVAIKHRLGKLPIAPEHLLDIAVKAGFRTLQVSCEHAAATALLPPHHQDPFDRLLLAQARLECLKLITVDADLLRYGEGVERL